MNTEKDKKAHLPLTGRRYNSVDEFLDGESVAPDIREGVSKLDKDTVVAQHLVQARRDAGLTQQQMAERLHKTQGAISKLESSNDNEITLEEISDYAGATNQNFSLMIGKPMNHIESVKYHAHGIKRHLSALAKEAHRNEEAEQAVQAFFGEAFFNILAILGKCHQEMPDNNVQVRIRKVGHMAQSQATELSTSRTMIA